MKLFSKSIILIALLLAGCFSPLSYAEVEENENNQDNQIKDPYEKFNRVMFEFNDTVGEYCLKPIARLYKKIVPRPLNKGIHHILQNVYSESSIFNDLLQANFYQATSDSWRFVVNSTIGLGGFFDVASDIGLPSNSTNFGITLAKWGYKDSNYLVLPFWGPSTMRDTFGLPIDYLTSIYPHVPDVGRRNVLAGIEILDIRAQALRFEDVYEMSYNQPVLRNYGRR